MNRFLARRIAVLAGILALSTAVSPTGAAGLAVSPAAALIVPSPPAASGHGPAAFPPVCRSGGLHAAGLPAAPEEIRMTPARRSGGAEGVMRVRLGDSPYGVAVRPDGSYRYHVEVTLEALPAPERHVFVVWAATPDLDRHVRLGALEGTGSVSGSVAWNKFLVFVTAERSADVESWSQRFVLSALSPSGRMHTMAGHGPFSGEPCLDPRQ